MSYQTQKVVLKTREKGPGNNGEQVVQVSPWGQVEIGPAGIAQGFTGNRIVDTFSLLPGTSVAAGTSKYLTVAGTGTEVIAADTKGGVLLTTQASTPTAADNVLLSGVASTPFSFTIRNNQRVFEAVVNLPSIADILGSFGLNENVTDPDPTGTAGDGVAFLADPNENVTTGLASALHANWILAYKVNGADTFADSGVPLAASTDVAFRIAIQSDLTAKCYINQVLVGTSPVLTSGDTVKAFLGLETDTSAQKSFVARRVSSDYTWA